MTEGSTEFPTFAYHERARQRQSPKTAIFQIREREIVKSEMYDVIAPGVSSDERGIIVTLADYIV